MSVCQQILCWLMLPVLRFHSMRKGAAAEKILGCHLECLQSQQQDTGKYCTTGTHELHQRYSLFWEQLTSLSSKIILSFWGRVENVRHLKLLRLSSVPVTISKNPNCSTRTPIFSLFNCQQYSMELRGGAPHSRWGFCQQSCLGK